MTKSGAALERGTVRFFRRDREFGYIIPDSGGADVFVHLYTLELSDIETLQRGDRVEFERVDDKRGGQAHRLRLVPSDVMNPETIS